MPNLCGFCSVVCCELYHVIDFFHRGVSGKVWKFISRQLDHEGTVAMIQVATVPFNFSYLEVLDFKDFLSSVGSMLRENAETKGNFLILGVHFII